MYRRALLTLTVCPSNYSDVEFTRLLGELNIIKCINSYGIIAIRNDFVR